MSGLVSIVLIAAAIVYVMARRIMGEPVQGKRMLLLPAILTVIGIANEVNSLHSVTAIVFLVVSAAISVVIGALRGASVRISNRNGIAFVRYTWVTVLLWLANIALKLGANVIFAHADLQIAGATTNSLIATLGVGMLVEGGIVMMRAMRTDGQVLWSVGRDSGPRVLGNRTGAPTQDDSEYESIGSFGYDPRRYDVRR